MAISLSTTLVLAGVSSSGWAVSVNRCADAEGRVSYSEAPCPPVSQTKVLDVDARAPDLPGAARRPQITLTYDPRGAPAAWTPVRMASAIRRASQAWMRGCPVNLVYAGEESAEQSAQFGRLSVRWSASMASSHASPGLSVLGRGGPGFGIALSPRLSERQIDRVLTHEMGHVLGLPHVHDDPLSVMSYLPDRDVQESVTPAGRDWALCSEIIRLRFGSEEEKRQALEALKARPAPRISDGEAVQRMQSGRR